MSRSKPYVDALEFARARIVDEADCTIDPSIKCGMHAAIKIINRTIEDYWRWTGDES